MLFKGYFLESREFGDFRKDVEAWRMKHFDVKLRHEFCIKPDVRDCLGLYAHLAAQGVCLLLYGTRQSRQNLFDKENYLSNWFPWVDNQLMAEFRDEGFLGDIRSTVINIYCLCGGYGLYNSAVEYFPDWEGNRMPHKEDMLSFVKNEKVQFFGDDTRSPNYQPALHFYMLGSMANMIRCRGRYDPHTGNYHNYFPVVTRLIEDMDYILYGKVLERLSYPVWLEEYSKNFLAFYHRAAEIAEKARQEASQKERPEKEPSGVQEKEVSIQKESDPQYPEGAEHVY